MFLKNEINAKIIFIKIMTVILNTSLRYFEYLLKEKPLNLSGILLKIFIFIKKSAESLIINEKTFILQRYSNVL